jgi:hypothetical protein
MGIPTAATSLPDNTRPRWRDLMRLARKRVSFVSECAIKTSARTDERKSKIVRLVMPYNLQFLAGFNSEVSPVLVMVLDGPTSPHRHVVGTSCPIHPSQCHEDKTPSSIPPFTISIPALRHHFTPLYSIAHFTPLALALPFVGVGATPCAGESRSQQPLARGRPLTSCSSFLTTCTREL